MPAKKTYQITISGGGLHNIQRGVIEHTIEGYPGTTYHKLVLSDGKILYYNDFGVRTVLVEEEPVK